MIDPDNATLRTFRRKVLRKMEFADNESTLFEQNVHTNYSPTYWEFLNYLQKLQNTRPCAGKREITQVFPLLRSS